METDYLKKCFGNCLAQALAEVATVRPSDPIEYLAHWLYHYRAIAKAKEEVCVCVCASVWTLACHGLAPKRLSFPRIV